MASSIQDRMAYLRDLLKKRRKKTDEPTQVQSASTQSNQTSSPQKQTTVGNQRGNEAILQTRKKQEQAQQKASDSSMRKNQTTKQASIADMLWFNGANILKTDDENYVEDKPAKKSKKSTAATPMIRKPNIEYMRDPVSGKAKDAETMPLSDLMLMFRQLPAAERAEASELFEQDYLRRKSSPYYDPYYTTKSNNKTAVELWGTDDLTSVVTDPENLKYLDYVRVSKNGQSPLAPTKKSSVNERKGYSLFYLLQDYEDEQSAKNEMPALYREIGELAQAYPDASEQEILDMVDWSMTDDDGNKAFKTISDYRESAANRMEKYTVGGGLYVGDESLKAVVRAARRGEDVSEIKDYLSEDVDNRLWQMMGDENAKRRPKTVDSASSMSGESQADGDTGKSIINQIGDKYLESEFKSNADRIGAGLGSLVSKALQSTAGGIRSFYNTYGLGARRNADPMEQSVSTTGKIDLRDPNIPETQWEYLIQAGLSSADQRDAILAQRQGDQAYQTVPGQNESEYTGMASGTFNAQSSAAESSGMSMQELSAYKETLTAQLAALQQNEQSNAQNLPAVEQEIFKLENDLANGADPEATNAALSELYAKRDAMVGSADNQAGRSAAVMRIQSELADVNEGIAALRGSALKRSKAAQQAQQKPAETTEQRTARLMSANIDEMSADVSMLETAGRDARDRYSELTARIGEIEALVGGLNKERAEQDPSLMAAYSELQQMREERSAIEIANPDLDLTSDSDLNTRIMRKKHEVLDAARLQYNALADTAEDFTFYAAKGMAMNNSSPGAGSVIADNISNPATYAQDHQAEISAVIYLGTGNKGDAGLSKLYNMGFMTDEEVQTYSYLLANKEKYGPEKAELYYQSILDELEYRQGERIAGAVSENTAASIAYGGLSGIGSAVQGLTQVAKPNEIVPYNAAQYAGGIIREGLAGKGSDVLGSSIAQWGFDTAQTLGNMLPVIAVNFVAPGSGPVVIGASAGGNAYNQSLREGHTQEEATRFALLSGVSEAGLESVLGMAATGGGKLASMVSKKTASAMSGAAIDVLKGLAATMISNGTEEYLQDVLVPLFDTLAYGDEFKGLDLTDPEALRSGIMGALIAVIGDSPEIASRVLGTKALGSDFNSPDQIAAMLEAGAMAPEGSKAQTDSEAAAVRMEEGKSLDDYRVGKLVESVGPDLIAMVEAGRDSTAAPEADAEQAGSPSMEDVQASAEEMQTDTPDVELSDDAIRAANLAARQVAIAASSDQKSFTPEMLRRQEQIDTFKVQIKDAIGKQTAARQTVDDLTRKNGEILLAIQHGETNLDSGSKQIQRNVQESVKAATEIERQSARYASLSSQLYPISIQQSKAIGEIYQAAYQVELNRQLAAVGQEAAKAQGEANVSAQKEAAVAEPKSVESVQAEPIAAPVSEQPAKQVAAPSMEQQPEQPKPVQKVEKAKPAAPKKAAPKEIAPKEAASKAKRTSPRKLAEANGSMPLREGALVGEYVPKSGNTNRVRRVSETARDLYRSLGVPYTAKNKPKLLSRKAVAVYESHPGVVVTRTFQNVAGYAHEIGHALFDRAKVFDAHGEATDSFRADIDRMVQNLPKAFRDNYDASDLPQEAAAEFVRAYLTDWNAAVNFAGEAFVRRFENEILSRTEVKALRTARERFNATLAAELADVYRARIDYSGKQDVARGAEGAWGRFIQGFADKYYSVLLFDIAANKAGYRNSDPNKRAYIAFSNIPYSVTQAANIVETNLSAPDGRVIGLSMKDVTRPITRANMNDFDTYLLALHDIDRQEQGKPVFGDYTAETSEQVARQMEALHPEFKQVHGDLMTWWDTFIDEWVVKNNAIENAAEKVARFRELYPNYVPTFRSKNDQVDVMTEEFGDMGGLLGQASVHFQKAKGGDQAIKSPIASMVARVGEIVTAANKVEAMRRVHEAYQATPGMGEWLRKVPADKATGNGKDEMLRIIDADGAVHHYQVMDKLFYDALLGGASKSDGKLWDAIGRLTGVFKQLTTMSNPFFAISNAMRDYTEAYTKGSNPEPVTFALQWVKAIAELTAGQFGKDTKTLDAYYAVGGGDSSISPRGMLGVQNMERTMYSKYFPDALRRMVAGRGLKERARGGADVLHVASSKLKGVINAFNNVIEGSQRYAEFSRTMRRTGDARTAMYASTNVTTDFRRAGNWDGIHKAGRVFAFMNAGIQGTYSWYRLAKESRFDRKAFYSKATRAAVMFAMVPIAAKMLIDSMGDDDKEAYAAMAENVKADNILIPKSLVGGKAGEFYKIPKPKGPIPAVGDALGRALIEAMEKEGSWDAFSAYGMEDWAESSVESLIDSMNPYGSPIFAPVLQVMMNQTWYGSPIESKWMRDDDIAPANRIKDTTSSAAIWLANLPGLKHKVSPIQVDYVLNQTLGVAGDYITGDVGNALIDGVAGKQNGYRSGSSTAEFVRTRLNTDPTAASDITSSMYDADSLLQGIVADSEQDGPNQDPYARLNPGLTESEQKTAVREAKNMTKKGGVLYKAKKLTSAHYDEIDKIEADAKLTDEERTKKTRAIKWQMILENKVAVDAAEDYIRKYIKGTPAMYAKVYGK